MVKKENSQYRLGRGSIFVVDDFISKAEQKSLALFFGSQLYRKGESDTKKSERIKTWVYNFDLKILGKMTLEEQIHEEIKKLFKANKLKIHRAYCNSLSFGDSLFTHIDSSEKKPCITALLYVNDIWKKDWGGETLFFDSKGDARYAVTPKPGRLALFDGFIKHRAGAPESHCFESRLTFAIKYWVL